VTAPADLVGALPEGVAVHGRGATLYPDLFAAPSGPLDVDAGAVAELAVRGLGTGEGLLPPEPLYLRRPDAAPPGARKRVLT
jgi:hypothetical protein